MKFGEDIYNGADEILLGLNVLSDMCGRKIKKSMQKLTYNQQSLQILKPNMFILIEIEGLILKQLPFLKHKQDNIIQCMFLQTAINSTNT